MRISTVGPSTWTSKSGFAVLVDFKIARWGYSEKISNEIVPAPTGQIQIATFSMIHVGNNEHVEVLVSFHEGISEAHRLDDVDIIINVAVFDQQVPLKPVRHGDVRLFGIIGTDWESLVEFVPPGLVQSRVVISGDRDTDLIEIGKYQHGMGGAVSSGRGPEDSDTRRIHVGILSGHLLDHGDVIFECSAQVPIRIFVERPRAAC